MPNLPSQEELTPPPRLRWRRARPGCYWAGPYRVTRLPLPLPIWRTTRVHPDKWGWEDLGVSGTAAEAKQTAAWDWAGTEPSWSKAVKKTT